MGREYGNKPRISSPPVYHIRVALLRSAPLAAVKYDMPSRDESSRVEPSGVEPSPVH